MRLREAVARMQTTSELFIANAITNALEAMGNEALRIPEGWEPLLAQRFLELLPTPAVIKDSDTKIVWCNFAYENLFDRPRQSLVGHSLSDLGLLEKHSAKRLEQDHRALLRLRKKQAKEFWEPLTLIARGGVVLFRTHRFVFRGSPSREPFIGDLSFDWGQIMPGNYRQPLPNLPSRLRCSSVHDFVFNLFPLFLASCPAAIAIKTKDGSLVWCNTEYEHLAQQTLVSLQGKRSQEIFGIGDKHSVVQSEFTVASSNVWMYTVDQLPDRKPRTSLRFPISTESGRCAFIGVVSAEFEQEDIRSHGF